MTSRPSMTSPSIVPNLDRPSRACTAPLSLHCTAFIPFHHPARTYRVFRCQNPNPLPRKPSLSTTTTECPRHLYSRVFQSHRLRRVSTSCPETRRAFREIISVRFPPHSPIMDPATPNAPFKWEAASGLGTLATCPSLSTPLPPPKEQSVRLRMNDMTYPSDRAQLLPLLNEDVQSQSSSNLLRPPQHPLLPISSDHACNWNQSQLFLLCPGRRVAREQTPEGKSLARPVMP